MEKPQILWADDEIDLLLPHVIFLREKGYDVLTVNNGDDAIEKVRNQDFDIILLDENMPGLSGLETLAQIKNLKSHLPVIMITKSEEEHIMEDAIGNKIADYLIKPVNPNQILLSLKKNLDNKRLISEKSNSLYLQEFRQIGMRITDRLNYNDWVDVYKKLVYWELELERNPDQSMYEILVSQKDEANLMWSKFVENNYVSWLKTPDHSPSLSHQLFKNKVFPMADAIEEPIYFVLIDNLRWDQWKIIQPVISEYFRVTEEDTYCAILPTATQYARNAIFAGMMPSEIEKRFPKMWFNDEEEEGKNLYEPDFLADQLQRNRKNYKFSYTKITNHQSGKELVENIHRMADNKLNVIVYNFVDMLSHARTEMEMIRELAENEKSYRSITLSWFMNSPLFEALKRVSEKPCKLIITTDHGTIRVKQAVKIVGDKNTNSNLRYKNGKSLSYDKKEVFEIKNPADAMLPRQHVSSSFVFAKSDDFFAYPNNYNYYVTYYRDTFQHGGVSLEEMIVPIISLSSK